MRNYRLGYLVACILFCCFLLSSVAGGEQAGELVNFRRENLVAWCIVPFDAKQRGPAARAEMVKRLGLRRVAYDWREKHVGEFEDEILQYKRHGIEYFAFWSWHDAMEPLIRKHEIKPQIWITCPSPDHDAQLVRVGAAAEKLLPLVEKTRALGLKLGLYNHGGWGGEPANLIAVCQHLRTHHRAQHVGIVYNLHHGHGQIADFAVAMQHLKPYLLCLNLNGMRSPEDVATDPAANKIVPIGQGQYEAEMIRQIMAAQYEGPIGILGHRADLDVEVALQSNLEGLEHMLGNN